MHDLEGLFCKSVNSWIIGQIRSGRKKTTWAESGSTGLLTLGLRRRWASGLRATQRKASRGEWHSSRLALDLSKRGGVLVPELLLDAEDAKEPAMQGALASGDVGHGGGADPGTGWRPMRDLRRGRGSAAMARL